MLAKVLIPHLFRLVKDLIYSIYFLLLIFYFLDSSFTLSLLAHMPASLLTYQLLSNSMIDAKTLPIHSFIQLRFSLSVHLSLCPPFIGLSVDLSSTNLTFTIENSCSSFSWNSI